MTDQLEELKEKAKYIYTYKEQKKIVEDWTFEASELLQFIAQHDAELIKSVFERLGIEQDDEQIKRHIEQYQPKPKEQG